MAAPFKRSVFNIFTKFARSRGFSEGREAFRLLTQSAAVICTIYGIVYVRRHELQLCAKKARSKSDQEGEGGAQGAPSEPKLEPLSNRERRFIRFASCEYDGQLYMTPGDFLDSITETDPKPRLSRRKLSKQELDKALDLTPPKKKGGIRLFRSLENSGIISYTEYLFLLSVLTKPHSGFHTAFKMFDTDGNQRVDKHEFLVVRRIIIAWLLFGSIEIISKVPPRDLERIFSCAIRERKNNKAKDDTELRLYSQNDILEPEASEKDHVNTTLVVHLFGKNGKDSLSFSDFCTFMENLQSEVLELEFMEYSKGKPIISEVDFARILLRYTYINSANYEAVLERVKRRIPEVKGITFEQFKSFCQFLNNLDDFAIAMRMFTYANQPVSQEEFHRAVLICTGHHLDVALVNTVFQIFDADGDGHLSYKEFIAIMRDRIHRGLRSHLIAQEGWDAFKSCVKEELRST